MQFQYRLTKIMYTKINYNKIKIKNKMYNYAKNNMYPPNIINNIYIENKC